MLDLSTGNRLLDATRARTAVPLPGADLVRLAAALAEGAALSFIMAAILLVFIVVYMRIVRVREEPS